MTKFQIAAICFASSRIQVLPSMHLARKSPRVPLAEQRQHSDTTKAKLLIRERNIMSAAIYQSLRTERKILESMLLAIDRSARCGRVNEAVRFSKMARESLERLTVLMQQSGPLPVTFTTDFKELSTKVRNLAAPPTQPFEQVVA